LVWWPTARGRRTVLLLRRTEKENREVEVDRERTPRRDIQIEKIMRPAVCVGPDTTARETLKIMRDNNVPGVPVVGSDGILEGFVNDGHLLESALPQYMKLMESMSFVPEEADKWVHYLTEAADKPVREVMSRQVSQVELGRSELAVAHRMVRDGVSSVVITRDGEVVGIVNRLDLYAAIEGID
jgi:CBS domain-containing protein